MVAPSPPVTLCGSLSLHPVGLGAAMHVAGYRALGLPYTYVPFAMTSDRLAGALDAMRTLGIRGLGVSMPFKIEVLALVDSVDPLARTIGAVNTLVNDDGCIVGHNTDAEGAARALEEELASIRGARCLVLGAGGAARAVVHGLAARGAEVLVANRTLARAEELADSARGAYAVPFADAVAGGVPCDVLVNASSAGMDEGSGAGPSPFDDAAIRPRLVVMDIVYKPIRTALVAQADRLGARVVHGGRMLLHQAARQFELYTGRPAPLEAMDEALRANVG